MPRPPRVAYENALYHVTSRGNARQRLFFTDADRARFVLQLEENLDTYGVVLLAWVLMANHFHLVVKTPRANLSRFMQRLNSSYSLYYRYKHKRPGHVLGGRYKARVIEEEGYLLAVTRYVHLNPVKTAEQERRTAAERFRYLERYPWSSYPAYAGRKSFPDWLSKGVLREYGREVNTACRRYRAYVRAGILGEDEWLQDGMRSSAHAIGSVAFIEQTERMLADRATGGVSDADVSLPRKGVALEVIDRVISEQYGVPVESLRKHGRSAGEAKAAAVELAARRSGQTLRAIGQHYGGISGQAVAMIRRRAREAERIDGRRLEEALDQELK